MKWPDQHLKNLDILKLIREDHGWALSRILLAEELEAERDALREEVTNLRSREQRTSSEGAKRSKELRAERDALREALRELDQWASRMPDAGFTDQSPRWQWWNERPRVERPE